MEFIYLMAQKIHSYVGTLLSSCNLHNLYIMGFAEEYPLSLDLWHPAAPCSLRKLCIEGCPCYKVPNWMGSPGNLVVLKLTIICLRPEDVEILGAIPSLLFLELKTAGGTKGRIIVRGNNGFRSLKYFSLRICYCGTALEFQVGSMPNLDQMCVYVNDNSVRCVFFSAISDAIMTLPNRPTVRFETWFDGCQHLECMS
ncbi:hypothetical protein SEVIR_6G042600v4 [Setaria viridis]|uniref:Disease resistance R13L4/SHOC-2-like LRR domain-containing protein n=1 Tax=Setaria viridis TaxID=4556 RepID=A0A4U6U4X2_SETVI|nr:hypothetical protein SEVIR_6G042600v2 [Setaria viridis]